MEKAINLFSGSHRIDDGILKATTTTLVLQHASIFIVLVFLPVPFETSGV